MNYVVQNVSSKQELEKTIDFFRMIFKDKPATDINNLEYSLQKWEERRQKYSDLMLYASLNNEVIGIVFGRIIDDNSITIGPVAVHKNYRGRGIAKEMMLLLEERALQYGIHSIKLGAVEAAEGFYSKLGYTGSLLVQSEIHSIEQLLSLTHKYKVEFTNIYNSKVSQVCLEVRELDRELQREYEAAFPGCHTLMMYSKTI